MIEIDGYYCSGDTSEQFGVTMTFDVSGNLTLRGDNIDKSYAFSDLNISPRVGNTPRNIYLGDGGKCEALANDEIDKLLSHLEQGIVPRLVHQLESRLPYVLAAIVMTAAFVWGFTNHGIPFIAKRVAFAMPESADEALGAHTMRILDKLIFSESRLDGESQKRIQGQFSELAKHIDDKHGYNLLFRSSEAIGANAFALPSGIIVITDGLVDLAENDNELISVFAHEFGHVKHRHGMRTVLQGSAVVLIMTWLTGDISSMSALSAALPAKLIEAKYSRDFEAEADEFAKVFLTEQQIPLSHFGAILERLHESLGSDEEMTFLSSHPAMRSRIEQLNSENPE